jgi:uncharacterized delta-60 repeat protein
MTKSLLLLVILLLVTTPAFAQSVDTAWVRRYNGPGNNDDEAFALAVDSSGNVYVTGESFGSGTYYDYATIKYYPNGDTAWVRRYNGPGNIHDDASGIVVDGSGNVYVAGESYGSGTYYDYATIKYYANGDTAWVRRYNGPADSSDWASAIAVDSSGNVYVTGRSYGSGTDEDFATIKYDQDGNELWVKRYNGPGNLDDGASAIAIDGSGNVYVTGYSYNSGANQDYATIKYYPNGDTAWVRRYNGPINGWDHAFAIVVDSSKNAYVTGGSYSWPSENYATIKYFPDGSIDWVRGYNGPGNDQDEAWAIAVDRSGNVYVTGLSYGNESQYDYATIRYPNNGTSGWVRRYNGPGNSWDYAYAIAADSSGNAYVTGVSWGSETYYDYATIKYDSIGNELWVQRYNGPGTDWDLASAIAIDGSGNVYVTGGSSGIGTNIDYATIKYVQFVRGDCDKDASISLVDVILLANYVLKGGPSPNPLQSGDVNCDGKYDLVDVIKLARYVLFGEPFPC